MKIAEYLIEKKISENDDFHLFLAKIETIDEKRLFFISKHDEALQFEKKESNFFLNPIEEKSENDIDFFTTEFLKAKFFKERISIQAYSKKELKIFLKQLLLLIKKETSLFHENNLLVVGNNVPAYLPIVNDNDKFVTPKQFFIQVILMNFYKSAEIEALLEDKSERHIRFNNDLDRDIADLLLKLFEDDTSLIDKEVDAALNNLNENNYDKSFTFLESLKNDVFLKLHSGKDLYLLSSTEIEQRMLADYFYHEIYTKNSSVYLNLNKFYQADYSFLFNLVEGLKRNQLINEDFEKRLSNYFTDFYAFIKEKNADENFQILSDRIIQGFDQIFREIENNNITYVLIENASYIDRKSLEIINKIFPLLEKSSLKFLLFVRTSAAIRMVHYIENLNYSLRSLESINNSDFLKIIKTELKLDDISSNLFLNNSQIKTEKSLDKIIKHIQYFKMLRFLSQEKEDQELVQEMKHFDERDLTSKIIKEHDKLAEIFLFFAIIKTVINQDELDTLFQNANDLDKILDYLTEIGFLIYRSGFKKGHELSTDLIREAIYSDIEEDITKEIIKSVAKSSRLRDIVDFDRVLLFLKEKNQFEDLSDIQVKFSLFLNSVRNFELAAKNLESALQVLATTKMELSKSFTEQITFSLLNVYEKIGLYEHALKLSDDILKNNFQLEYEKRIYLQTKIASLYYKMDQYEEAKQFIDDKCLGYHNSQNDTNKRLDYYHLISELDHFLIKKIDIFPDFLQNSDLEPYIKFNYLNGIFQKILEESNTEKIDQFLAKLQGLSLKSYHESELKKNIAKYYIHIADYKKAISLLKEIITVVETENDRFNLAEIYYLFGSIKIVDNKAKEAIEDFKKALNYYVDSALNKKAAITLSNIAILYKDFGEFSKALDCEKMAIKVFRENNDLKNLAYSLMNAGHVNCYLYFFSDAEQFFREAEHIAEYLEDMDLLSRVKMYMALVLSETDRAKEADITLVQTLNIISDDDYDNYINYLYYKSYVDIHQHRLDEARRQLLMAFDSEEIAKNSKYSFAFTYLLGKVLRLQGDDDYAEKLLLKSKDLSRKNHHLYYYFQSLLELKELYKKNDNMKLQQCLIELTSTMKEIETQIDDPVLLIQFQENNKIEALKSEIIVDD